VSASHGIPLLHLHEVSIQADGPRHSAGRKLLEAFSLTVRRGEFLAIVGESGSGKTMAARSVLRLLPPGVRQTGGRIEFDGEDLGLATSADIRRIRGGQIGMVMQDPMASLNPGMTVGRQLEEALKLHREITRDERIMACRTMLERVQIADPDRCLTSYPHEFSGGMRQRIMLASVMLLRPKLLIADEPTTALDTLNQKAVMDIIADLARETDAAVLLISHNLALVSRYAKRVVVLERGRTVEAGTVRDVLEAPKHSYTRMLVDSLPRRREPRPTSAGEATRTLVAVRNLSVIFRRRGRPQDLADPPAVADVTLQVAPSETVAVVGGSGSGKTTLGRAILGLLPHATGEVTFDGIDHRNGASSSMRSFRQQTQLVFQDPYSSLDPRMRVGDIVAEPLRHVLALAPKDRMTRMREMLDEVGLGAFEICFPHQLSGGQRQRVAIARAVVARPRFVVADEPVSALDATIQAQVLALFQKLQQQYGFACLFITHDLAVVEQIADRVVVMKNGRIVEQGTVASVFDHPQTDYTRALLEAAPSFPKPRPHS
jgi:peptide/nickel transport system ATP-binding protein